MKRSIIGSTALLILVAVASCQNPTTVSPMTDVAVTIPFQGNCPQMPATTNCANTAWAAVPGAVCGTGGRHRILWSGAHAFNIDFPHDRKSDLCSDNDHKTCRLKSLNHGSASAFEYDITAQGCPTIDPYIIVLR